MVRPALAPSSPSLGQLCSLRALASTAVSISRLVIFCLVSSVLSEPGASYAVSELGPAPPSLSFGQLHRLWALSSSAVSGPWQAPVSGPEPAPNLFQLHRRLRVLSSLAICESWSVPRSPSPGQLRRLRGLEEIRRLRAPGKLRRLRAPGKLRRLRAPGQLRHFRAVSSSAVSYPWLGPPSLSPQKAPDPGPALVFESRASSTVSEYSGTRVPIYILSYWTGPAPHAQSWGGGGSCPSAPCSYATGSVPSRSLAHDWDSTYRRVLPPRIG